MRLIYRGEIYPHTPTAPKLYTYPRALNWRYQTADFTPNLAKPVTFIDQSRAINWRYQTQS